MKYFTRKLGRREKVETKLTALDKTVLEKCKSGSDISGVISACKPFVNRSGSKEFATTDDIVRSVNKLFNERLLERR